MCCFGSGEAFDLQRNKLLKLSDNCSELKSNIYPKDARLEVTQ